MSNPLIMRIVTFCLLVLYSAWAQAGIVIGGTRFVFHGSEDTLSLHVRNTSSLPYLIQTKIMPSEAQPMESDSAFMPTPPLFVLNAGRENAVRIVNISERLPQDRESLFWLVIAGIPAASKSGNTNTVQFAVRNRMKLFYRPAGLSDAAAKKAPSRLQWARSGAAVQINNPTPYYVTLVNVTVNGHSIEDATMLAPFATESRPWCDASRCEIRWQALNDLGVAQPARRVEPGEQPRKGSPR
ncbi:molecular chaperone [Enterobacter sp. RIT418]|uniref:fimbrial biogenesis chaperone n=1 Tax=Enterobacter sp. RIT418 TaxID=2202164 RepID=UPI000D439C5B|nr:molecular chaperone [Enterobacter sp. RIT 418]RAU36569.1 molecular chaperone [Enterobacter sp. RIT 418]